MSRLGAVSSVLLVLVCTGSKATEALGEGEPYPPISSANSYSRYTIQYLYVDSQSHLLMRKRRRKPVYLIWETNTGFRHEVASGENK